ncbi:hypothetical protein KCP76_10860 [Salmonella enterica subsp. enterica serovar Weltevreden]|nr:hypothetical protein KCP76_10860 [Salmonella enterica subsp. enterica serovar Weltevreden]
MKLLAEEEAAKLVNPEELKQDAIDAVEQLQFPSCLSMKLTKFVSVAKPPPGCFTRRRTARLNKPLVEAARFRPNTGWSKRIIFCLSPWRVPQWRSRSIWIPELQGRLPIRVELQARPPAISNAFDRAKRPSPCSIKR